ncbi:MAG TPA: LCP family protein, partial [Jiangellales bacterium]|nr:LCP family protein [Jiangellales bacterium]
MASTTAPMRPPGQPREPRPRPPHPRAVERRRLAEQRALRRALVLLGGTLVVPGTAQLAAGSRRVGRIALRAWLALLLAGALVWFLVPRGWLLGLAVRPFWLGTFTLLAWTVGIAWALLLLDAWRLSRPPDLRRWHRVAVLALTLALCAAVVVPFSYAARFASTQRDLVVSLFPSGEAAVASDGRLNVLLLGGDTGDDRVGTRTDSIHLLSVDVSTGQPVLFSLPRNLQRAPFPDGTPADREFPRGFEGEGDQSAYLLNALYTYGTENPELFPGDGDPGIEAVQQAVSATLGLDVHYHAFVDMAGFVELVDALGGVEIDVRQRVEIPDASFVIEPGVQRMDGNHALWFARSRTGSDDYARMARQRCVISAVAAQADPKVVLANYQAVAAATEGVLATDIPQDALPRVLELALQAKDRPLTAVQFVPPLIQPADPDLDLIRQTVDDTIKASEESAGSGDAGSGNGSAGAAP